MRVKNSLKGPVRKLTGWALGLKERKLSAKRRTKSGRGGGGRGGRGGRSRSRRNPPPRPAHARDPSVSRSYQADLEKERRVEMK